MARATQIRRTQVLTTYGPGAIVETEGGPRVMLMPGPGLFDPEHLMPVNFEIAHPSLSVAIGGRVYRLPSNEELGRPPGRAVYRTRAFPAWKRCPDDSILYVRRCPRCGMSDRGEAVRFVCACENGHMDELDWVGLVHPPGIARCDTDHLEWLGGGGTLSEVRIRCPVCGADRSLGDVYYRDLTCKGRHPEQEADGQARRGACSSPARVIHRGAVRLFIPHVLSVLVIPPFDMPPWSLLLHPAMQDALVGIAAGTKSLDAAQIRAVARALAERGRLPAAHADAIDSHTDQELVEAAEEVLTDPVPADFPGILRKEFRALRAAATRGAPPSTPRRGVLPGFEVRLADVREVRGPSGMRFRVAPVSRLRVILAQKGFSRLSPTAPPVDTAYVDADGRWYPGIDRQGEGIFIETLDPIVLSGAAARRWQTARNAIATTTPEIFRNPADPEEAEPAFVWWHTLAHRLITALGVDSGLSSTAIRERIYVERERGGILVGGILLYAVQPGGDGTQGGLIALVPEFERVLRGALADIDVCSNDPFCGSRHPAVDSYVGAACYACLFASETSCDHRNLWLDRAMLLEVGP
jgi:hypothetical protein